MLILSVAVVAAIVDHVAVDAVESGLIGNGNVDPNAIALVVAVIVVIVVIFVNSTTSVNVNFIAIRAVVPTVLFGTVIAFISICCHLF